MTPRWDAFICYRRRDGEPAARWLYHRLVRFRPPRGFGEWPPLRIFLDAATERAGNNFYENDILPELEASIHLIVVCTESSDQWLPNREPNWQQREILDFLKAHPTHSIIPVIVDGDIKNGPLPVGLHEKFSNIHRVDGRAFRNFMWRVRPLLRSVLRDELVDVAGALRNVPRDRMILLHRLDARAQLRNALGVILLAILIAVALTVLSVATVRARDAQVRELVRSLTRQGASLALKAPSSAALLFARAIELSEGRQDGIDEQARMWLGLVREPSERRFEQGSPVRTGAFSSNGSRIATGGDDGSIFVWDIVGSGAPRKMRHEKGITYLEFSSDGNLLASASWDGTARVWNADTGAQVLSVKHGSGVNVARFSPASDLLVSAGWDDNAIVWNIASGKRVAVFPTKFMANVVEFDPKGRTMITADAGGQLCFYETARWLPVHPECYQQKSDITAAHYSASGRRIALATDLGGVDLIDVLSQRFTQLEVDRGDPAFAVAISPVDDGIVAYGAQRRARIINADEGPSGVVELPHDGAVRDIRFSHDGRFVLTASDDGTARLRETRDGRELTLPFDHVGVIFCARFSPDSQLVLTCGADGVARLRPTTARSPLVADLVDPENERSPVNAIAFDSVAGLVMFGNNHGSVLVHRLADGGEVARLTSNPVGIGGVDALVSDPSGKFLAVVGGEGPVRLYGIQDWTRPPLQVGSATEYATTVAFSSEGRIIVVGYQGGEVQAFTTADAKPLFAKVKAPRGPAKEDTAYTGRVQALAVSPSNDTFLSAHEDGGVHMWSIREGRALQDLNHLYDVKSVMYSPDGRAVLTAAGDGTAKLWSIEGTRAVERLRLAHGSPIQFSTFSHDATRILTAGNDNSAAIWSVAKGEELVSRLRHGQSLWSASLSPNDRLVATASQDGTAQVWDSELGEKIGLPLRHRAAVTLALFSPDGRFLVTAGFDGHTMIWKVPRFDGPGQGLLETLRQETGLEIDPATQGIRIAHP